MALLKTAPDVRLLVPRPLVAGEIAEFIVELTCPKPVPVDAVSLTLFGEMVWFTQGQYGRSRSSSRFLEHRADLLEGAMTVGGELEAGQHRLSTRVRLAQTVPGSWSGTNLAVEYGVAVHVDIPWWPDKRVEFVVRVQNRQPLASASAGASRAHVYVSHAGGPPAKGGAYLELSTAQTSLQPGSQLRMSAALGNVAQASYRKLIVSLLAQESSPNGLGGTYLQEHAAASWHVALDAHAAELEPIPFSLTLPRNLTPAFELHGCKLGWMLQVRADVPWGADPTIRLPVDVVPADAAPQAEDQEQAAPLAVGSDRLRLIWSKVAHDTGLEFVDDRIRGEGGEREGGRESGITIDIHRGHDDGRTQVLGVLEFPALGVGLRLHSQRTGLLGGVSKSVAGRDPRQSAVLEWALGRSLVAVQSDLRADLLDVADDRLTLALPGAGLEFGPLLDFARALVEIAARVAAVPDQLPAPAVMEPHAEAWTRAAATLGASVRPGDLRLTLRRGEQRLDIGGIYDDQGGLRALALTLDPGVQIPSRHHLVWTDDAPLPENGLALAPVTAPPTWTDEPRLALHIEREQIRVLFLAALPDPTLERDRVEALFELGRALRGELSPYR